MIGVWEKAGGRVELLGLWSAMEASGMRARLVNERGGWKPAPPGRWGEVWMRRAACLVLAIATCGTVAFGQEAAPVMAEAAGGGGVGGGAADAGVVFAWPARYGDAGAIGRCVAIDSPGGRAFVRAPWWEKSADVAIENAALLKALREGVAHGPDREPVLSGRGYLMFRSLKEGELESAAYATGASRWFRVASARAVDGLGGEESRSLRVDQTWFGLYEPLPDEKGAAVAARGVVLVLPGMLGTPEPVVEGLVARLRERGFAVLRCLTHPARYCSHQEFEIDAVDAGAAGLASLAKELDDRVAEYAYAVREAWRHAVDSREDLKDLPRGVVGMSGGAIALPTVVALEPEKYAAAVLIAGGCNGFEVADRSNYADMLDAVRIEWKGEATFTFKAASYQAYFKHTTLDGYHTARTLAGKKVLVIHATKDEAVPSRLGQLLWERLGKPERWVYPMGHEGVFAMQMLQNGRTADWVAGALGVEGR